MTADHSEAALRKRLAELERQITAAEKRLAGSQGAARGELQALRQRHGDLESRLTALTQASGKDMRAQWEADYDGLVRSLQRWIERQDRGAHKR